MMVHMLKQELSFFSFIKKKHKYSHSIKIKLNVLKLPELCLGHSEDPIYIAKYYTNSFVSQLYYFILE